VRWQRAARWLFAIAGLGCAVALYALTRERPAATNRDAGPVLTKGATAQSSEGVANRYRLNLLIASIEHHGEEVFEDGRVVWKGATMTFKEDGTIISADSIESKGKSGGQGLPAELILTGTVKLTGKDGETAEADAATYNENTGILVIPDDVKFTRGKMAGSGKKATYTRATGVFLIQEEGHVILLPTDTSGPVDATSTSVTFNRANRSMLFAGKAVIARADETMSSDNATLYLADTDDTFRVIELRANARVTPVAGKPSSVPDMRADNIDLAFYPGTQMLQQGHLAGNARMVQTDERGARSIIAPTIDFGTAPDGKTLTRLDARKPVEVQLPASKDAPARRVNAQTLVAQGDDQHGLTRALFEGGARFEETIPATAGQPARTRVGEARSLSLALKGQLDTIDDATFQDNVKFVDGDTTGVGDIGIYYSAREELWLQPLPKNTKRPPNVVSKDMTIDAAEIIKVDLKNDNVSAKRDVKTVMANSDKNAKKSASTLFDPTKKVLGFGDEFTYDSAKKIAKFTGSKAKPAHLRQGDDDDVTEVFGLELILFKDTSDLNATGAVRSIFSVTDEGGAASATKAATPAVKRRYDITSETLVYKDGAHLATYTGVPGTPAVLKAGTEGNIEASRIDLRLAEASRSLERLDASRSKDPRGDFTGETIFATLEGGREARGDVLVYDALTGRYTLKGKPLFIKSKESDGTCSLSSGSEAMFSKEGGDPQFPREKNPGGSSSEKKDCSISIRAIK